MRVLYEDNHVIVVLKPINVPSQKDSSNDVDLVTMVKNYLKEKYNKPGDAYLGLVHRLDRPVSGVMVLAKTSKAAKRLSLSIKNGEFHKKYLAVLDGMLDSSSGVLVDKIKRLDNGNSIIDDEGKEAKLEYEVLDVRDNKTLVKIILLTGRHHQIRVQFKNLGYPLCGDQRYNKQDKTQIALFAYELEFVHPVKKEWLKFRVLPNDLEYFNQFNLELD